jgi:hypothetical protein
MVGKFIGHADLLVKFVIFNDLALGLFILVNIQKKITYIWAGTWLLIVAGIKMMNLFN